MPISIRLFSGSLTIRGINQHTLPEERLDIWNDPRAPPQLLPQSVLHGRCGALLAISHGVQEEDLSTSHSSICQTCGYTQPSPSPSLRSESAMEHPSSDRIDSVIRKRMETLPRHFGTPFESSPGRLLFCGGYGMFELWDHNVTMRCNEVSF